MNSEKTCKRPIYRILLYFENYQYGGLEKYLTDLTEGLRNNGHTVNIMKNVCFSTDALTARIDGLRYGKPILSLLKATIFPLRYIFFIPNIFLLTLKFKGSDSDIIHIVNGGYPGSFSSLAAVFAAKLAGKRSTFVILSTPIKRRIPIIDKAIDLQLCKVADKIVLNSEFAKSKMIELRGIQVDKMQVIHTSSKEIEFVSDLNVKEWKEFQQFSPDHKIIVMVAAFEPLKAHTDLLEAFALLLKTGMNVQLVLIGSGKTKEAMQAKSIELGINPSVIFTGYCEKQQIINWLSICDLFAFSSHWEGLPYAIEEAMLAKKPVVAYSVGGIPELVDSTNGRLVEVGNIPTFSAAMQEILLNPKMAKEMGEAGRAKMLEKFSYNQMIDKTIKMYGDLE